MQSEGKAVSEIGSIEELRTEAFKDCCFRVCHLTAVSRYFDITGPGDLRSRNVLDKIFQTENHPRN